MTYRRWIAVALFILGVNLSSCSPISRAEIGSWRKEGATVEEWHDAVAYCTYKSRADANRAGPGIGNPRAFQLASFRDCMRERGFERLPQ
jgi:hypothetical protein